MRIIGSTGSPFVRKVRIVAAEKGLSIALQKESPLPEDGAVVAANPLGKIPALVCDDGTVLADSPVIAEYLDSLATPPRLLPTAGPERFAVRQWEAIADGVLDAAVLIRLETMMRAEGERSASWVARQRGKMERGMRWMDERLGTQPFCVGDSLTLADVAADCALGYLLFRFNETDWRSQHPNLARLHATLASRPAFASAPFEA